jgi:hypothetical protein
MHLVARVRWFLARRPWVYWLVVAAVAGFAALGAECAAAGIETARRSWGQQTTVWVTESAIDPGAPIAAHQREVPRAMAPADAVTSSPQAAIARQHIGTGEIITAVDVSVAGQAALIPDGWVAVAVPVAAEHFAVGAHVAVYAADQFVAAGIVTDLGESDAMVAVPAAAAPTVAAALLDGSVILGLTAGA